MALVSTRPSQPITREGLTRAAERVKLWRRLRAMNQMAFAAHAGVSVGCIQGLESLGRVMRPKQLAAVAAALNLTVDELVSVEAPPGKTDPRLKDLRDEDLQIAQLFHHAATDAKSAVRSFFDPELSDETRDRVARVLGRLLRIDPDIFASVEAMLTAIERDQRPHPTQPAVPVRPVTTPADRRRAQQ